MGRLNDEESDSLLRSGADDGRRGWALQPCPAIGPTRQEALGAVLHKTILAAEAIGDAVLAIRECGLFLVRREHRPERPARERIGPSRGKGAGSSDDAANDDSGPQPAPTENDGQAPSRDDQDDSQQSSGVCSASCKCGYHAPGGGFGKRLLRNPAATGFVTGHPKVGRGYNDHLVRAPLHNVAYLFMPGEGLKHNLYADFVKDELQPRVHYRTVDGGLYLTTFKSLSSVMRELPRQQFVQLNRNVIGSLAELLWFQGDPRGDQYEESEDQVDPYADLGGVRVGFDIRIVRDGIDPLLLNGLSPRLRRKLENGDRKALETVRVGGEYLKKIRELFDPAAVCWIGGDCGW